MRRGEASHRLGEAEDGDEQQNPESDIVNPEVEENNADDSHTNRPEPA